MTVAKIQNHRKPSKPPALCVVLKAEQDQIRYRRKVPAGRRTVLQLYNSVYCPFSAENCKSSSAPSLRRVHFARNDDRGSVAGSGLTSRCQNQGPHSYAVAFAGISLVPAFSRASCSSDSPSFVFRGFTADRKQGSRFTELICLMQCNFEKPAWFSTSVGRSRRFHHHQILSVYPSSGSSPILSFPCPTSQNFVGSVGGVSDPISALCQELPPNSSQHRRAGIRWPTARRVGSKCGSMMRVPGNPSTRSRCVSLLWSSVSHWLPRHKASRT